MISTADVPVQRKGWWEEEVVAATVGGQGNNIGKMPVELQGMVFEGVEEYPISMEKAKQLREDLMDERKEFVISNSKEFGARTVSLCEH